ncbi:MAG: glycosyltransferase family 4 protein [Porticoccus sp.]
MKQHIVHIIFSLDTGGAENLLIDIANEQSKSEKVSVIIINNAYSQKLVDAFLPEVRVVCLERQANTNPVLAMIKIYSFLLFKKASFLHVHDATTLKMFPPVFKKIGLPTIFTVHDTMLDAPPSIVSRVHYLCAISHSVQEHIVQKYPGIPSVVVHNGVNVGLIQKKQSEASGDIVKIIQVGRLSHDIKGQDLLLDASTRLKLNGFRHSITFAGEGASEEYLKELATNFGITDNVEFLGNVDRNWLYQNLQYYDILVQPSRTEGFGLTVVEGMAAGLPVLVSDNEGPFEIINRGELGYHFFSGDSVSLTSSLVDLIQNLESETIQLMCNKAYTKVVQEYSVSQTASSYVNLIDIIQEEHYR